MLPPSHSAMGFRHITTHLRTFCTPHPSSLSHRYTHEPPLLASAPTWTSRTSNRSKRRRVATPSRCESPPPPPRAWTPSVPRLLSCACAPQVLREHLPPLALRGAASSLPSRLSRRRVSLALPVGSRGFLLSGAQGVSAGHACVWTGGGGRFCLSVRAVSELSVCVCPYGIQSIQSSFIHHFITVSSHLRSACVAPGERACVEEMG